MNIASVVIRALPGALTEVEQQLAGMSGVEVHARSDDGRLVVTIEAEDKGHVGDTVVQLHALDGVLTAAMIYEQSFVDDSETESDEASSGQTLNETLVVEAV